jgi:hypothetical protein
MFAHFNAGHIRADGPEVAAILRRRVRLHVIRFGVRRPPWQPDEDDRFVVGVSGVVGPQLPRHDASSAEPAESEPADLEKIPP